jgi:hypothetical protein
MKLNQYEALKQMEEELYEETGQGYNTSGL